MQIFDKKLADYIKQYPALLSFLDRLGIRLGFGDKSINDICEDYNVDKYFFVELLQLIIKKNEFNPKYIHKFKIRHTVTYLINSHNSYKEDCLPEIQGYINQLTEYEKDRLKDLKVLNQYFQEYHKEFLEHLDYEESDIYPYISRLEESLNTGSPDSSLLERIEKNSITNYLMRHGSLDEKLSDLKNLLIKYIKPFKNKYLVRSLLKTLYELEKDLILHELIENQILFPQVKLIEDNFKKQAGE